MDFWSFFNINIVSKEVCSDTINYILKTGGFQDEIDLVIGTNLRNEISHSTLYVNRSWIIGEPYGINPFALDVVRSFILSTISPLDINSIKNLSELFQPHVIFQYYEKFRNIKTEDSYQFNFVMVYLGLLEEYTLPLKYSSVSFKKSNKDDINYFSSKDYQERLEISTSVDTI